MRIHILGAPGAGVTTLGKELAAILSVPHFDVDDYHWFTGDDLPYRRRRNPDHRRQLLRGDLEAHESWVLSGSLCGWGDVFIPQFESVVWLWRPVEVRLAQIRAREQARYGPERIAPGGDLHGVFEKFMSWAAAYDEPSDNIRSRDRELEWMEGLSCRVLKLETAMDAEEVLMRVLKHL